MGLNVERLGPGERPHCEASDQRKGLSTRGMCLAATTNQLVTLAPLVLCGRGGGRSRAEMEGCGWVALLPSLCWNMSQSLAEMLCVYPNVALRTSSNVKDQESKQERKASYYESNQEEAPPMRLRQCKCLQPAADNGGLNCLMKSILIFLSTFLSFSQSVKILYGKPCHILLMYLNIWIVFDMLYYVLWL